MVPTKISDVSRTTERRSPAALSYGLVVVFLLTSTTLIAQQSDPLLPASADKKAGEKQARNAAPMTMDLDKLVRLALRNNPDIAVAEARVREAEAELARIRLQVTREVVGLRQALESHTALKELSQNRRERLKLQVKVTMQQFRAGDVQQTAVLAAEQALKMAEEEVVRNEAKLAELRTQLPYLTGNKTNTITASGNAIRSAAQQRLLRALAAPTPVNYKNVPIKDLIEFLKKLHGIQFVVEGSTEKLLRSTITLRSEDASLRVVLQQIEDRNPELKFYVRDYGILLGPKGKPYQTLDDFLK